MWKFICALISLGKKGGIRALFSGAFKLMILLFIFSAFIMFTLAAVLSSEHAMRLMIALGILILPFIFVFKNLK